MSRLVRRVRTARRSDSGLTIPELLVTMFLLSMITVLMVGLVAAFSQTFTRDRAASDSTMVASAGMKEVTRIVRSGTELRLTGGGVVSAPVFVDARENDLTLYAFIDTNAASPRPIKVRFSIDGNRRLIETRWRTTNAVAPWSFAAVGSPSSSRPVARFVPTDAEPIFRYLDAGNQVMPVPTGGFTTEQLRTIAAVQVTLTVQADAAGRADRVVMQNSVGIPNRGISRVRP